VYVGAEYSTHADLMNGKIMLLCIGCIREPVFTLIFSWLRPVHQIAIKCASHSLLPQKEMCQTVTPSQPIFPFNCMVSTSNCFFQLLHHPVCEPFCFYHFDSAFGKHPSIHLFVANPTNTWTMVETPQSDSTPYVLKESPTIFLACQMSENNN
jgi:hypothetical protein